MQIATEVQLDIQFFFPFSIRIFRFFVLRLKPFGSSLH
jgi:hypothetical protein